MENSEHEEQKRVQREVFLRLLKLKKDEIEKARKEELFRNALGSRLKIQGKPPGE